MSLILDALRKSEGERQRGHIPTISSSHSPVGRRPRLRLWSILLLIGSALAFFEVHVWSGGSVGLLDATWLAAHKARVDPTAHAATAAPAEHAGAPPKQHAAIAGDADPPDDLRPRARPPSAHPTGSPGPAVPAPTTRRASLPRVPAREAASAVQSDSLPMLWELPGSIARSMPDLQVTVHVYSKNASDRFVRLNGSKYREQDHVALDLVLEAITEEGMVMNYKGTRFRLKI